GMDRFVRKYQPELYDDWSRGINVTSHPEDEQMLKNNTTIVRSSPTKTRLPIHCKSSKSKKNSCLGERF
ncbi:unnamed protein product, partial [Rotaria magnacalcarata]